jgi:hypothetical protein
MVDAHPLVAVIHETLWIPQFLRDRKGVVRDGLVTPDLIPSLVNHPRFSTLGMESADLHGVLDSLETPTYSAFVTGLFDLYGRARGKYLVGDKSPPYIRHIHTLSRLWPETRFVHIIRDGRDVALSVMAWKKREHAAGKFAIWGEDPATTSALWWKRKVLSGREGAGKLDPHLYTETLYESLVTDPEGELRRLCSFLRVPYDEAMLRYHEGRMRTEPGLSAKKAWLPPTPGLRDWRKDMPSEDVERFEAAAGDLLQELGYERGVPRPSRAVVREAERLGAAFSDEILAKGGRLPKGWSVGMVGRG